MYNPTGAELAAAKKQHQRILKAPTKNQAFLDAIDDALALRSAAQAKAEDRPVLTQISRRMDRVSRVARLRVARAADARGCCRAPRPPAWAQAWVPPAGLGSVTVAVQTINNTGHTDTDGVFTRIGRSVNTRIDIEADYAFTDRLSLSAGLPFVFAKYVDPLPYGPPGSAVSDVPAGMIPFPPRDECRCWQSGWQDFGFTARYNLINGAFALTPSVSVGVPSHDYAFRGEAVVGQRLKEMRISVDAGQRLDAISPRLYVQGRYSYAFVERVLDDVPNNRSNATVEGGFLITRRLAVRGLLLWQRVHGGLRFRGIGFICASIPGRGQHAGAHVRARSPPARQQLAVGRRHHVLDAADGRVRFLCRIRAGDRLACRSGVHGRRQLAVRAGLAPSPLSCEVEGPQPTVPRMHTSI